MINLLRNQFLALSLLLAAACGGKLTPCEVDGDCDIAAGEICTNGECVPNGNGDPVCGNDIVEAGEQCDPPGATCDANCQSVIPAGCGDGTLAAPEVCDDGNNVAGDGCRADCSGLELCGDGISDAGEQCDDGNNFSGDGCSSACQAEGQCQGLGLQGATCTESADCCGLIGLGCVDSNGDGQGDVCSLGGAGLDIICGTGGDAHICQCADGLDNDGDGGFDTTSPTNDLQCLGPSDDNELEFATGVPGDNNGSNGATECPFDGNSGPGNDAECNLFLPNGCDCTLCCELDGDGNGTFEDLSAGGGNCREATPNDVVGSEGGPCTFVAVDDPNRGGCGEVDIAGTNVELQCIQNTDGTAYCSTCNSCVNVLEDADPNNDECINECNCCENCVGGQTAECDPALAGTGDVGVEGGDGDADTINNCPVDQVVCETNIGCDPATAGTDCPNLGETCEPGSNGVDVCFQATCDVANPCSAGLFCNNGCCVLIP